MDRSPASRRAILKASSRAPRRLPAWGGGSLPDLDLIGVAEIQAARMAVLAEVDAVRLGSRSICFRGGRWRRRAVRLSRVAPAMGRRHAERFEPFILDDVDAGLLGVIEGRRAGESRAGSAVAGDGRRSCFRAGSRAGSWRGVAALPWRAGCFWRVVERLAAGGRADCRG